MDPLNLTPHEAAMVAKADSLTPAAPVVAPVVAPVAAPVAAAVRPEGVPEKFWDAAAGTVNTAALLASYSALEKSKGNTNTPPVVPAVAPVVPPVAAAAGTPEAEAAAAALAAAQAVGVDTTKVDFNALTQEFSTTGELSAESYAALEATGMSKSLVDSFIAGQQAIQTQSLNEAYAVAGGADAYGTMLRWAGANMAPAETAAFDAAVTGDTATRNQAITALKARYTAAHGTTPNLVSGEAGAAAATAFQSRAEVTAAMRDPRYKADPAYRADVARRLDGMTVF